MLKLVYLSKFVTDLKLAKKQHKKFSELEKIVTLLQQNQLLPPKNHNHKLKGDYAGYWECHVEPDWLLIYKISKTELTLARIGSHADLF